MEGWYGGKGQYRAAQRAGRQEGSGLAEVMLAAALLSIAVLGLLDYRQRLGAMQQQLRDTLHGLALSHQALELRHQPTLAGALPLPDGWRLILIDRPQEYGCVCATATVRTAAGERISLSEWFCGEAAVSYTQESTVGTSAVRTHSQAAPAGLLPGRAQPTACVPRK